MTKHEFNRIFDMLNKNAAHSGNKKSFDESYADELAGTLYQLEVLSYAYAIAVKEVEKVTGMDAGQFMDMCLAVARKEIENRLQNEMDKEWDKDNGKDKKMFL